MATLNLLPRKEFEITLDNGTIIKGKFGTWALKRLCDKRKATLQESAVILNSFGGIIDYILTAVEYVSRKNNEGFAFADTDVCEWIDELGGVGNANFASLVNHTSDESAATTDEPDAEKKTDI